MIKLSSTLGTGPSSANQSPHPRKAVVKKSAAADELIAYCTRRLNPNIVIRISSLSSIVIFPNYKSANYIVGNSVFGNQPSTWDERLGGSGANYSAPNSPKLSPTIPAEPQRERTMVAIKQYTLLVGNDREWLKSSLGFPLPLWPSSSNWIESIHPFIVLDGVPGLNQPQGLLMNLLRWSFLSWTIESLW